MLEETKPNGVFPQSLYVAFPIVYFLHLLDERFWGPGTANWATAHSPLYFTNSAWLWVNVPSMLLLALVARLTARQQLPAWAAVAVAMHLALHAVMRIVGTAVFESVSPGLVTGVFLCLPLAIPTLVRAYNRLPASQLRRGVLAGILSFQPLWHVVLYPVVPHGPVSAQF